VIELILYILSTGLLVYLAEKGEWVYFSIFFGVSFVLFVLLKLFELKPIRVYFSNLEKREFYFKNRLLKNGIVDFYNLSDLKENFEKISQLRQCLQSANFVKYVSLTGFMLINRDSKLLYDDMINFLEKGNLLKLIIVDPKSEALMLRNTIHNIKESNLSIDYAKEINDKYKNLEIRVCKHSIYGSSFITNEVIFFDPYHLGKDTNSINNRFFTIKILKLKESMFYNIMDSHFENLWGNSVNFKDYINK